MTGPRTSQADDLARYRVGTTAEPPADLARAILDRLPLMPVPFDVLLDPAGNVYAGTHTADAVGVAMARNPSWLVGTYSRNNPAARIAREIEMHRGSRGSRDAFAPRGRGTSRDALAPVGAAEAAMPLLTCGSGGSRDALRPDPDDELPPCVGTAMRDTAADMLRDQAARQ
jgi:hypothetical protein